MRNPILLAFRCLAAATLAALALLPAAFAAPPGSSDGATDGKPFEHDDAATLATLRSFSGLVSGTAIHACVATVTQAPATSYRLMGTPTHDAFLQEHGSDFARLGLASAVQHFTKGGPGLTGAEPDTGGDNLVAVLPGADLHRWVVLGGHYDTREATLGGGALDNASGICTVLELAHALTQLDAPLQASVIFVWYDGEEWGLYGSVAFAEDPSVAKVLLGIPATDNVTVLVSQSYDMPGLNYPAKNTWLQYGNATDVDKVAVLNLRTAPTHPEEEWACWSYGCYADLKQRPDAANLTLRNTHYQGLVREVAYDVLGLPRTYVWVYDDAYGRSDHIPLIARGAAGMRIQGSHDAEYPHYHQPTDSLPALELEAGGKDLLVQGYETEARIGGTTAAYVALRGDVGDYGYLRLAPTPAANGTDSPSPSTTHSTPTVSPLWLVPALAAAAAFSGQRRRGST